MQCTTRRVTRVGPESESAGASRVTTAGLANVITDSKPITFLDPLSEMAIRWLTLPISGGMDSSALSWIVLDPDEPVARRA